MGGVFFKFLPHLPLLLPLPPQVPRECFQALTKLRQLSSAKRFRDAVRNDCFPSVEMLQSLAKEFGAPLTQHDLEEMRRKMAEEEEEAERERRRKEEEESMAAAGKGGGQQFYQLASREASRMLAKLKQVQKTVDNVNPEYERALAAAAESTTAKTNYVRDNKAKIVAMETEMAEKRAAQRPEVVRQEGCENIYSSQKWNSSVLAKEKVAKR